MSIILTTIYFFILALSLAILEIQIEGAHGWAKNLPTWRPAANTWYSKLYAQIMSGKELTGYHLSMFGFVLLVFHLPYIYGYPLDLVNWLKTLSAYLMFVIIWDFLWFVLNPYHPLKNFRKEHIWWHKSWFLGLPIDYYLGCLFSLLVLLPTLLIINFTPVFYWWVLNWGILIGLTLTVVGFSRYILKIDNWVLKG